MRGLGGLVWMWFSEGHPVETNPYICGQIARLKTALAPLTDCVLCVGMYAYVFVCMCVCVCVCVCVCLTPLAADAGGQQ